MDRFGDVEGYFTAGMMAIGRVEGLLRFKMRAKGAAQLPEVMHVLLYRGV